MGLFTKGPHKFRVTAKGADRNAVVVHWSIMKFFAVPFVLTAVGLALPFFGDFSPTAHAGDEEGVMLFWSLYSVAALGLAMLVCIERPRPLHTMRNPVTEVSVTARSGSGPMWLKDSSPEGATLHGVRHFSEGETIRVMVPYVGEASATVARVTSDGAAISFALTVPQRALLLTRLHTNLTSSARRNVGEPAFYETLN